MIAGEEQTGSRTPTVSPRILLVEDERVNRALMRAVLGRAANDRLRTAALVEAGTLREAREALASGAFDLVVLDVHLPDGAGLDLALEIRDADLVRRPRILVLSASVLPAEQEAAMTAGCDAFMAKPYRPTELLAMIEKLTSADD